MSNLSQIKSNNTLPNHTKAEFHASKKEPSPAADNNLEDSCFSKSICSATDCTGLIPALPSTEAELEAYEEMYQFCLQNAADDPKIPK